MQMYPKLQDFTFKCRECRFNPWWGKYDPTCLSAKKNHNINQKRYCNKFNEDFKNGPHKKKSIPKLRDTCLTPNRHLGP